MVDEYLRSFSTASLHIITDLGWLLIVIPAIMFDIVLIRRFYRQRNKDFITVTYNCIYAVLMLVVTLWLVNLK